jgi:DNA-binding NarL/FixJ family response regulator
MPTDEPLRVIVADDDAFARRVIKGALNDPAIRVIAEAKDGREAVQLAVFHRPDVVVMDVVMPELDGILATRRILQEIPEQLVVLLTNSAEEEIGLLALQAGAVGFLSKEAEIDALPRVLKAVGAGEGAISRTMTLRLIEHLRAVPTGAAGFRPVKGPLTSREWEVIDLLKPGRSTDAVADVLVVSTETVRSHVKNIMRKLAVHSRADAVAAADALRATPL